MVKAVALDRYSVSDQFPEREEAGTPDTTGAIGLATALHVLYKMGMETVREDGDYQHRNFSIDVAEFFSIQKAVDFACGGPEHHSSGSLA